MLVRSRELRSWRRAVPFLSRPPTAALAGWLGWLPLYLIFFDTGVTPGHAGDRPFRPLFEEQFVPEFNRIAAPVFSTEGAEEIVLQLLILGVPVALLLALVRDELRRPVVFATVPVLAMAIIYWPVQGIGNDTDSFAAMFPAFFAIAWLLARSPRLSLVAVVVLFFCHAALDPVLTTEDFVHGPLS